MTIDVNSPASSEQLRTIAEMVLASLSKGRSLRNLAADSGNVDHNTFFLIKQGKVSKFPDPETIEGIARALGVDTRSVIMGFARQLGIDVVENRSMLAGMLPATAQNLSVSQARAVANLVREMVPAGSEAAAMPLDVSTFSGENVKSVIRLYQELRGRGVTAAEADNAEMRSVFDALAAVLRPAATSGQEDS